MEVKRSTVQCGDTGSLLLGTLMYFPTVIAESWVVNIHTFLYYAGKWRTLVR